MSLYLLTNRTSSTLAIDTDLAVQPKQSFQLFFLFPLLLTVRLSSFSTIMDEHYDFSDARE